MAAIPQEDFLLVAAIDFGTTFSGYAFSMRHDFEKDPLKVSTNSWTAPSGGVVSLKTPTTLLLKPDKSFDSFGYEAEDHYADLADNDDHEGYYYYRRFKMKLFQQEERLTRNTLLKDIHGKDLPAIDVFAHSIEYLKNHLLDTLKTRGTTMHAGDIQWVLTVPAIWEEPAKQFMKEAAEKAGITGGQLMIALEPEAASLFCKYLPLEKLVDSDTSGLTAFSPGNRYLVLDAGGGTVDITVHEVKSNGTLQELDHASGGAWGGTYVDQSFKEMLEDIVGKDELERFTREHTAEYIDIFRDFETKKRNIPENKKTKITIKVSTSLVEFFENGNDGAFERAIKTGKFKNDVFLAGDKMRISNDCFRSFFSAATESTISHVKLLLKSPKVKGTKNILMVGGFSESPLLQETVREAFPDCRIIIPQEAGLSVLKGAVIFGHKPKIIVGRVAKLTYGISTTVVFKKGKHKEEKKFDAEGKPRCKDVFSKHVTIGDALKIDDIQSKSTYYPLYLNQTSVALPVYTSSNKCPEYVDDYGCNFLGTLTVKLENPSKGHEGVECSMIFGGTVLAVSGKENSTGKTTEARFDFLVDHPSSG